MIFKFFLLLDSFFDTNFIFLVNYFNSFFLSMLILIILVSFFSQVKKIIQFNIFYGTYNFFSFTLYIFFYTSWKMQKLFPNINLEKYARKSRNSAISLATIFAKTFAYNVILFTMPQLFLLRSTVAFQPLFKWGITIEFITPDRS